MTPMARSEWNVQMWLNFHVRAVFKGTANVPFSRPATTIPAQFNITCQLTQSRRNPRNVLVKHFGVILRADAGDVRRDEGSKGDLAAVELSRYLRHQRHGNGNHSQRRTRRNRGPAHFNQGILWRATVVNHDVTQVGKFLAA